MYNERYAYLIINKIVLRKMGLGPFVFIFCDNFSKGFFEIIKHSFIFFCLGSLKVHIVKSINFLKLKKKHADV